MLFNTTAGSCVMLYLFISKSSELSSWSAAIGISSMFSFSSFTSSRCLDQTFCVAFLVVSSVSYS